MLLYFWANIAPSAALARLRHLLEFVIRVLNGTRPINQEGKFSVLREDLLVGEVAKLVEKRGDGMLILVL